jgi:transcriptional regulator with XRE-family HTH domain
VYEILAALIRDRREALGLEQSDLAARIGMGQQAVSNWERGKGRPRRTSLPVIARELEIDEQALVEAGAYRADSLSSSRPPAQALSRALPVDELPPDRFEDLIADLMQERYPEGHATRFGGPGEKQFGIDILVSGHPDVIATAQCKRHQRFGPAAVKEAVAAVSISATRHHLVLSRLTATPGARREMATHAGWELWDGEDISRFVRQLSLDRAVRIVDTYFPGHRESFLGMPQPSPWLPPEDMFAEPAGQIFTHEWALAGRSEELERLANAMYGPERAFAALVGRGGIGKTRLLRAVSEAAPDSSVQVRVLPSGVIVDPADFEALPNSDHLVVLVDDAHERDDVAYVVAGIWRQNSNARVLIATRPYGWELLKSALSRAALLPDDPLLIMLGDLSAKDAEELAKQALGDGHPGVVQRLARLTLDCPLATVVGGVLIRRGRLDPGQLENDDAIRDAIMRGFRDALVADPEAADPETRSAVLDAVAALQPVRSSEEHFRSALSALVGRPFDVLNKHLRSLEDAGILRRRGASLRITPDLLGDAILAQACYDERANAETGYLDRVRHVAEAQVLQHLFVNVSRMDWQVKRRHANSPSLVDALWEPLEDEVKRADIVGRQELIKLLTRVAYFQPERAIAMARWLIDNPTHEVSSEHVVWRFMHEPTYDDVLRALPPMLKATAYTFEQLPVALDLLWTLARSDNRATNQFPEHASRVLQEIATFEIGKPPSYNEMVVEAATKWFRDGQAVSPFTVLEPLFATEGSSQSYQDYTLTFQPFALNVDAVTSVRNRVINLALTEARETDIGRAVAGVHALESALRYPTGMYGRPVSQEERDLWTPGFVHTIERLGQVADSGPDPVVIVAIRKTLHWHGSYSSTATRHAAEAILDALPDDLEHRVALLFHDGWGHLIRDREDDFELAHRKIEERLANTAAELSAMPDENEIIRLVTRRMSCERAAFGPSAGHAGPLIAALIKARPGLARLLIDLIASGSEPSLESLLPVAIACDAEHDALQALDHVRELLLLDSAQVKRSVARALSWNRGLRPLADGELDLIMDFARDPDPTARHAAAVVAQRIAKADAGAAARLVATIDFSDDPGLADEIFTCFSARHYGLAWSQLTARQIQTIKARLVRIPDIGKFWVTSALAERSASEPAWVISLLQDRVSHAEALEPLGNYQPMPFNWDNRLRVREHSDFLAHLRQLHAWIAQRPEEWKRAEFGAEIFQEVAGTYDTTVLTILTEALASTNQQDVLAVAAILRKGPRSLIWDAPDFVTAALHASSRFGEDCRQRIAGALWAATISGVRTGTPGQPYREDVEQRDHSLRLANTLPKGSPEEEFYRSIAASAEASIARSVEEDRADDGRDW